MNQEKKIETPQMMVKGNLIIWEKTMIQISSISYLSEAPLDKTPFPKWSLFPIIFGLYIFKESIMVGFFVISIGLGWIGIWMLINKIRQEKRILTIVMNGSQCLYFTFNDKAFLHKTMMILQTILVNGGLGSKNIVINIKDNKFSGNANFLNNTKM